MARKAIAAALASVVLFTVLVVADATVMSAQDDLASSAQTSLVESRELVLDQTLSGALSLQILAQAQGYLSSNPAECGGVPQYLGLISGNSSASGGDSGIVYLANASAMAVPGVPLPEGDNLTIVAPFAGWVPGALDLREDLTIKEVGGGGSVSLERREAHLLNIPIEADVASSLCSSTLGALASALSRSPCNATLELAAFGALLPGLVVEAAAEGFSLTAGWGQGGSACSAAYWITLVELGVAGATGSFDWTVRGYGETA